MTPLFYMILGHFVADYPLQNDWMAKGKNRHLNEKPKVPWYYTLAAHAATHGAAVAIATGSPLLALLEVITHWIIDLAKCEGLTNIHVDQCLHFACKCVWFYLLVVWGF